MLDLPIHQLLIFHFENHLKLSLPFHFFEPSFFVRFESVVASEAKQYEENQDQNILEFYIEFFGKFGVEEQRADNDHVDGEEQQTRFDMVVSNRCVDFVGGRALQMVHHFHHFVLVYLPFELAVHEGGGGVVVLRVLVEPGGALKRAPYEVDQSWLAERWVLLSEWLVCWAWQSHAHWLW